MKPVDEKAVAEVNDLCASVKAAMESSESTS
jgi:hypothetical protein